MDEIIKFFILTIILSAMAGIIAGIITEYFRRKD